MYHLIVSPQIHGRPGVYQTLSSRKLRWAGDEVKISQKKTSLRLMKEPTI